MRREERSRSKRKSQGEEGKEGKTERWRRRGGEDECPRKAGTGQKLF